MATKKKDTPKTDKDRLKEAMEKIGALKKDLLVANLTMTDNDEKIQKMNSDLFDASMTNARLKTHVRTLRSGLQGAWTGNDALRDLLVGGQMMPEGLSFRDYLRRKVMGRSMEIVENPVNSCGEAPARGEGSTYQPTEEKG